MNFKESVITNRPDSQAISRLDKLSILDVLHAVLGYKAEQFPELKIMQYANFSAYDAHISAQIKASDVKNSTRWSEMHDFATDLNDENLDESLLNYIELGLNNNLSMIDAYIRQFQINEIGPKDELVFFAFNDQEKEPDFNFYQLFIINEISRAIEEHRNIFSGVNGQSFMVVILNNLKQNIKRLTQEFYKLISNLQCGLVVVAEDHEQYWTGTEWKTDND